MTMLMRDYGPDLWSGSAAFITGQVIGVDGGSRSMWWQDRLSRPRRRSTPYPR